MAQKKYHYKEGDKVKVYDRETGKHITGEEAAKIPDFWSQVEKYNYPAPSTPSTTSSAPPADSLSAANIEAAKAQTPPQAPQTPPPEAITPEAITPEQIEPVEPVAEQSALQNIFGADWQPAPIFEELGLTQQGIYGAVRIKGMNDVYTIGTGGRRETAESYLERFGTAEQSGIVGEVSMEQAIKLGIVVEASSILEPLTPYEQWAEFRDEGKEEMDAMRANVKKVTQALIDKLMGFGEDKADAKDEEKEKLGIDEKDQAITDAEKVRADVFNAYQATLVGISNEPIPMNLIYGNQARIRTQMAIDLAPLDSNILIAYKAYGRAKDLLDDWSNDYNTNMQFQMQAAQMNIDMLTGELNREQTEQLEDAKIKFSLWQTEVSNQLATQEEVKTLMLAYPEAGVTISDSWDVAYHKISPYIQSEKDFEQKINDIKLKTAQKALNKPYYAPSSGSTPKEKVVSASDKANRANVVGIPQSYLTDILHSETYPDWFEQDMMKEHQMSKDWTQEWNAKVQPVRDIYFGEDTEKDTSDNALDEMLCTKYGICKK